MFCKKLNGKRQFQFIRTFFTIVAIVLAVSCFLISAIVFLTSLRQPNTKFFDIPVDLSKSKIYRTDFRPELYSLGIEFNLTFGEEYFPNEKLKDLEVQITVSDKTGQVLLDETKTRSDFRFNRIEGTPGSLRTTTSYYAYGLKGDLILEFKIINPAIALDGKVQHLTANCMRTGMEQVFALYVFLIGLISLPFAVFMIKRRNKKTTEYLLGSKTA
jgi:hypothetical protein